MKICIGIPTNRLINAKTALSLMRMVAYSKDIDLCFIIATRGYNTSENRNFIAMQALNNNCDYLFFVDDDMIFPSDTLEILLMANKDIVGGIYNTKYEVQKPVVESFDDDRPEGLFKVKA